MLLDKNIYKNVDKLSKIDFNQDKIKVFKIKVTDDKLIHQGETPR